jgi:anti-sigma28 factor (negative regulator of flagellin synthesis)
MASYWPSESNTMVNQVNDKSWSPLGGLAGPGPVANQPAAARPASGPAVKLELSETSRTGKTPAISLDDLASSDLVREIRERVESGRFTIDYEQLSQALLDDVVSQAIGRRG